MLTEITSVTEFTTKQDMARWTRAHADAPGINWTVQSGPGGTMIVIEHAVDRRELPSPASAATPAGVRS